MLYWMFALIGFTAVVAQNVLSRELVVVFHGNEMSLDLMLATWLLWTAVGRGLLSKLLAGVDLPTVNELMGHASITTTMRYARPGPEHKRAAVTRLQLATFRVKSMKTFNDDDEPAA